MVEGRFTLSDSHGTQATMEESAVERLVGHANLGGYGWCRVGLGQAWGLSVLRRSRSLFVSLGRSMQVVGKKLDTLQFTAIFPEFVL